MLARPSSMDLDQGRSRSRGKPFRGKRRHFRRVRRMADDFEILPKAESWWDHWHQHVDWNGRGNESWRYRHEHLEALLQILTKVAAARASFPGPFQAWIYLEGGEAGGDGIFLHSANPNGSRFPVIPEGVRWGVPLPSGRQLDAFQGLPLRVGQGPATGTEASLAQPSYFIYSPLVGRSLEQQS